MIIVADTSPVNYLILIKEIEILPKIYGHAVIPQAVHAELQCSPAPELVRAWIGDLPSWLEVRTPIAAPDAFIIDRSRCRRTRRDLASDGTSCRSIDC